ncbi:MAG: glycoside hydrolase family 127 protein [Candidatus Brocadiia bacterium]
MRGSGNAMELSLSTPLLALGLAAAALGGTHARLVPVPFTEVEVEDGFWSPRLATNRQKSIPHNLEMCRKTGRIHNFEHVAGVSDEPYRGHKFHDSDVYKVLQGVAHCRANRPDPQLRRQLEAVVGLVARSQQPDGYLNTFFTATAPEKRWRNLSHDHELYCAGHLFEAAVAHHQATGEETFLDVARRLADHIGGVFGPGRRHGIAGHPEIELALVKLWRATGEERYLRLAHFFVEEHGSAEHRKLFGTYCQDHKPIREQSQAVGHCVRAMYFYSAVADLAAVRGDAGYRAALERLWRDVVERKMYVTGGIGVKGHGEGFGKPFFLPNEDAYAETCAAIGMALWNHRMALLTGEGRFADVVERVLYNGLLSGVSLDGTRFFYQNPLASRGGHHRKAWYGCACCPTNVVRFLPALGGYAYAASAEGDAAYVLHYIGGSGTVPLEDGNVTLVQRTGYPWDGSVQIIVEPEGTERQFAVRLRIPGWCEGAKVSLNGEELPGVEVEHGFAAIRRKWAPGETIGLELPMPVRRVKPDPRVEANQGRTAIRRGPVVYCLEGCDHETSVLRLAIPPEAKLEAEFQPDLLGGVVVVRGTGRAYAVAETDEGLERQARDVPVTAVPYYAWDNREPGEMVVWVRTELPPAAEGKELTLAAVATPSASHCWQADHLRALNDGVLPQSSGDHGVPRFTWWPHRGSQEWVAYTWDQPHRLSRVEVYWFDDTGRGQCRVPRAWRLLWRDGQDWKPVEATTAYGVEKDRLNAVAFKPVTTAALRIEAELQAGFSGGILEWRASR